MKFTSVVLSASLLIIPFFHTPAAVGQVVTSQKTRDKVAKLATQLETEPLAKNAKKWRKDVLKLIASSPGLQVQPCNSLLGDILLEKQLGAAELRVQLAISAAKAAAADPDVAKDRERLYLLGLEGVLTAYRAMRSANPIVQNDFLNELLARQTQGELGKYVREAMRDCSRISSQP